ncbi:MAG: hypothetical protein H0V17_12550 [Deltaproteobacteria bacterium]|nr:hypothetical protein [Deltaproteobacteria bacterium]
MLQQKRMFKILGRVPKTNGSSYLMRVGTGWGNRDNSINIKLDAWPVSGELHLREMDEEELRKMQRPPDAVPPAMAGRDAPQASASVNTPPF